MRTFVAIEIDKSVRQRISALQDAMRPSAPRLRWADPLRLHLTLKFLGDVNEAHIDQIRAELDRIAASTPPFSIAIGDTGVFPPFGPPRVVWIGVKDATGALARCRDAVEAGIAPLGFPTEGRPYRPHLTLARCPDARAARDLRNLVSRHRDFDAGELSIRHIVLFKSTLTRQAPIYEPVSVHKLRAK